MIYFDAAYIAKCYLDEAGGEAVRALARAAEGIASCELSRLEFSNTVRRHLREDRLDAKGARAARAEFAADEDTGVWHWLPLNSELLKKASRAIEQLPVELFLRAGDALHLTCAQLHGYREIYTNDRHMLAAAPYFQLEGMNPAAE